MNNYIILGFILLCSIIIVQYQEYSYLSNKYNFVCSDGYRNAYDRALQRETDFAKK